MDDDRLRIEARLAALEYVLPHVAKIALLAANAKPEHAAMIQTQAKGIWREENLPGVAPELSDHMAAEIEEAVDELLSQTEQLMLKAWAKAKEAS